jgi:hypothetical protein
MARQHIRFWEMMKKSKKISVTVVKVMTAPGRTRNP